LPQLKSNNEAVGSWDFGNGGNLCGLPGPPRFSQLGLWIGGDVESLASSLVDGLGPSPLKNHGVSE